MYTQRVSRLPSRLACGWTFQSQKTLRHILQNFVSKVFGGLLWWLVCDSIQLWKSRVLHNEGLFQDRFQKLFIFPRIMWLFIFSSAFPSFKIIVFTHKLSIFFLTSSPNFEKRYGFCVLLNIFHISFFRFLVLGVLMIYVNMMLEYGYLLFWCDCVVSFVGYVFLHSVFGCTLCYL